MLIKPPEHPFEHPEYIENALIEFKERDWTDKSIKDILKEYRNTFVTIPICYLKMRKGTVIFRGRKNSGDNLFTQLNEIGLKDRSKVHSFGRANIPGEATLRE